MQTYECSQNTYILLFSFLLAVPFLFIDIVLIPNPNDIRKKTSESDVLKILKDIDVSKLKTKEIVDIVFNETGVSKKNIYKMWLDLSKGKK